MLSKDNMAYNYLCYAIDVQISRYITIKLKELCHLNNKGGVCASGKVNPERPSPIYNNNIKRLNMYQFCTLYFIIIFLLN